MLEGYPSTVNDSVAAAAASRAAAAVVGESAVIEPIPTAASEDFACMLAERPGAYLWVGAAEHDSAEHDSPTCESAESGAAGAQVVEVGWSQCYHSMGV